MHKLSIDYEVFSETSLKKHKLARYCLDPSTDPMCMAWAVDDGPVRVWMPGDEIPEQLYLAMQVFPVHAHNASFEQWVNNNVVAPRYGMPHLEASRMRCSAAQAALANMPRKLEQLCDRLGMGDLGKDMEGHKAMMKLAKPDRKGERVRDPDNIHVMRRYCARDVGCERRAEALLPPMQPEQQAQWELDRVINERGVPVDVDFCKGAMKIVTESYGRVTEQLDKQTRGEITTGNQVARILKFVNERGLNVGDIQADTVGWALDEKFGKVTPEIRTVLELRQMVASAAVKKYKAVLNEEVDGRIYEALLVFGALTARWAGQGAQFHNLKKGFAPDDLMVEVIKKGDLDTMNMLYSRSAIDLLGNVVRGFICTKPGKTLLLPDYSQIECRLLHWLAYDEPMLDVFRRGEDPYVGMAAQIYNIDPGQVTLEQRFGGKVGRLGCGFGMGAVKCANQYGLSIHLAETIVNAYRKHNQKVVKMWYAVDEAVKTTIRRGTVTQVGKLWFAMEGPWLIMRLPSGRKLYYYHPKLSRDEKNRVQIRYHSAKGWKKVWGATFVENSAQALCFDVMTPAMAEFERRGLPIVLTVHDQIIVEVDKQGAEEAQCEVLEIMSHGPEWADGLPLAAESYIYNRYRKT